ncbi:LysM-like peptidoglycan-binding domain-containing protein [Vibrio fortis]|uniref:LysM-like peptidoglycan-binding domain-containing protein n=1 Tax=Vibrio fortis TaxID=212667 RepID=UPI0040677383
MNRRHKKKQQVDYLQLCKDKFSAIEFGDAKDKIRSLWQRLPKLHQRALMVLTPVVLLLLIIPFPKTDTVQSTPTTSRVELEINTVGLSEQQSEQQQSLKSSHWKEYLVQQGDTLAQVFRNNQLPLSDLNALVRIEGDDKPLSQIRKGQLVRFKLAENGQLDILQLEKGGSSVMFFRLSDGGFGRSK